MKVDLISHTHDTVRVCAVAAWRCKSKAPIAELMQRPHPERVIATIMEEGHFAILEHAVFTFSIEWLSHIATRQVMRHRVGSYAGQSGRCVTEDDSYDVVCPDSVDNNDGAAEVWVEVIEGCKEAYRFLVNECGIPPEDARGLLPINGETSFIMTMNASSLLNFFSLRLCRKAQKEVREVARCMLDRVQVVFPEVFLGAGPDCECCKHPTKECRDADR